MLTPIYSAIGTTRLGSQCLAHNTTYYRPAGTVTGGLHGSRWKVQDFSQQQGSNVEQHDLHDDDDGGYVRYVPYVDARAIDWQAAHATLGPPHRER